MTAWPRGLDLGPIGTWPGVLTPVDERRVSPFASTQQTTDREGRTRWQRKQVSMTDTLALLDRELRALDADGTELLIPVPRDQFRLDGRPRADAKPAHPGVILAFTTHVGRLSYPCDTFTTWESNLRAIALALEALRKVDRYGVTTHGEQYRGFLALEASTSTTAADAERWLRAYVGATAEGWTVATVVKLAKRRAHPDMGGAAETFQRVLDAERAVMKG